MYKRILLFLGMLVPLMSYGNDLYRLGTLVKHVNVPAERIPELQALANINFHPDAKPLYNAYPHLEDNMPSISFGNLPTPVQETYEVAQTLGIGQLLIKCDSQTAIPGFFGGNKLRKAEFLLADAEKNGADAVMTFGCIGSNHATLIASVAQKRGLKCYVMLKPQPLSRVVQRNLLLMHQFGAEMHLYANNKERAQGAVDVCVQHKLQHGKFPYVIPTGGSCPEGVVGYVNAAFELKQQIQEGTLQEPDYIYVSSGSKGTTAGLILGVKAAGLKSVVVPVCVEPENEATYAQELIDLARATNDLLHKADPSFPLVELSAKDIPVIFDCCGQDYGVFSTEGMEAIKLMKAAGITLDGTYTAKGFAGLMKDAAQGKLAGKKVLFWNTYCADCEPVNKDYTRLPKEFHGYFEQDVQELDR